MDGPYPTVVRQPSGRTVLVVQAYQYGKYLGLLNVTFDDAGEVRRWSGQPVVLDGERDEAAERRLEAYKDRVSSQRHNVKMTDKHAEGTYIWYVVKIENESASFHSTLDWVLIFSSTLW